MFGPNAGSEDYCVSATIVPSVGNDTQLTLEQHRFELCRSTYTWILFKAKYYSNTWSILVKFKDMELHVQKTNYKVILGYFIVEGQHPNPHSFQRLTVAHSPLGMETGDRLNMMHDWEALWSSLAVHFQFQPNKHFLNICSTILTSKRGSLIPKDSFCLKSRVYSELPKHHFSCNYKTPSKKNKVVFGLFIILVYLFHSTYP